ncbi:MAG: CBS domain-containing protein [Syntrophomonadaceae bacterium]|nr:CBS domain-containing protein [Syntrophomonadaceae bacterium]
MVIITSHNALDFDGLASMVAANIIYPQAVQVFSGTLSRHVKKFMALYKDLIHIKTPKELDLDQVQCMIVVDTANINRLGHLKSIAARPQMEFIIYDHHPEAEDNLLGEKVEIHKVGAATTILVEEIKSQGISISPFDATILALGIYEDTGSLLFTSTTPRDIEAAAFLLGAGANLSVVANFMEQSFSGEQRLVLQDLMKNTHHYNIKNTDIIISYTTTDEFVQGLDALTYRLLEVENGEVAFVAAAMKGKTYVVGRSRSNNINVNEVLQSFGGRGHAKAASAIVKDIDLEGIIKRILTEAECLAKPGLLARDIMSTPVKTLAGDISMEEAGKTMLRYGHTGMPVVEGDRMIGVISRRDVEKAKIHELAHAPVKGFMTSGVLTATPDTPVNQIQKVMVEYDIGRLPIVENGRLYGIVSRTDILRTLHGDEYPEDHTVLYSAGPLEQENCLDLMQDRLPARILSTLRLAGQVAEELNCGVYCVGGFVRDLFLRLPNFDVDLVVEGDGIVLANQLAERLGGKAKIHERFKTAVITLPDGLKVDVATARTEFYEFPAALPRVERASIKEDLYRRDFTINTLAVALNPTKFGDLIDYFGGRKDLEKGIIKVLYNLSFVEDPTRILRAIRFEQRYKFTIEADTLKFARDAVARRILDKLSYARIMHELVLILEEKDPVPSLDRMKEIGVWTYIFPEVDLQQLDWIELRRVPVIIAWWHERYHMTGIQQWLIYLMLILSELEQEKGLAAVQRFYTSRQVLKSMEEAYKAPELLEHFRQQEHLPPSFIDDYIASWTQEGIIYLLRCIKDENIWQQLVQYLDLKADIKLGLSGHDLQHLGLKPGPQYSIILRELYKRKLDGIIKNKEQELEYLRKIIEEEEYINADNGNADSPASHINRIDLS